MISCYFSNQFISPAMMVVPPGVEPRTPDYQSSVFPVKLQNQNWGDVGVTIPSLRIHSPACIPQHLRHHKLVDQVGFEPTYARIKSPPFGLLNYWSIIV